MSKRSELINEAQLEGLYTHHPYLLLFQKEDWREYLVLLTDLYDLLEEDSLKVPYEVVRSFVIKFYAPKKLNNLDQKILTFFTMTIGELQVLKDSHDQFGQRFIESTRAGKSLLQLVEGLLSQRIRFSGTGAETLLGALNEILLSRREMTEEEAIEHHKLKIKAYQEDIHRIRKSGIGHAELLPIPHTNEALFNQAEEAAIHILTSIEDVKMAIERQRQDLAQSYFDGRRSAGQSLSAVAEFYENLYQSPEYSSYNQAKNILSHLDGFSARFAIKNVDRLLHRISTGELLAKDDLQKSQLRGFMGQFQSADHGIQEKVKTQIKLLQQQVLYSVSTDIRGLQNSLFQTLSLLLSRKEDALEFFAEEAHRLEISIASEFETGSIELFEFEVPTEVAGVPLRDAGLADDEQRALFLALLQAEETTLQNILQKFREKIVSQKIVELGSHSFSHGLAEYYVLSEIKVFDPEIESLEIGRGDLLIPTKHGDFFVREVPLCRYSLKESHSTHLTSASNSSSSTSLSRINGVPGVPNVIQ